MLGRKVLPFCTSATVRRRALARAKLEGRETNSGLVTEEELSARVASLQIKETDDEGASCSGENLPISRGKIEGNGANFRSKNIQMEKFSLTEYKIKGKVMSKSRVGTKRKHSDTQTKGASSSREVPKEDPSVSTLADGRLAESEGPLEEGQVVGRTELKGTEVGNAPSKGPSDVLTIVTLNKEGYIDLENCTANVQRTDSDFRELRFKFINLGDRDVQIEFSKRVPGVKLIGELYTSSQSAGSDRKHTLRPQESGIVRLRVFLQEEGETEGAFSEAAGSVHVHWIISKSRSVRRLLVIVYAFQNGTQDGPTTPPDSPTELKCDVTGAPESDIIDIDVQRNVAKRRLKAGRVDAALEIYDKVFRYLMSDKNEMDELSYEILLERIKCLNLLKLHYKSWKLQLQQINYLIKSSANTMETLVNLCDVALELYFLGKYDPIVIFLSKCHEILYNINLIDPKTALKYLNIITDKLYKNDWKYEALDFYDILFHTFSKVYDREDNFLFQVAIQRYVFCVQDKFMDCDLKEMNARQSAFKFMQFIYERQLEKGRDIIDVLQAMCKVVCNTKLTEAYTIQNQWIKIMKFTLLNKETDTKKILNLLQSIANLIKNFDNISRGAEIYTEFYNTVVNCYGENHQLSLNVFLHLKMLHFSL